MCIVLLSNIIAWPVAYFVMRNWLQGFVYRINIGLSIFLFASIAAFIIAIFTIAYQAVKASLSNPTEALRYE